jgi:hypothetical protein
MFRRVLSYTTLLNGTKYLLYATGIHYIIHKHTTITHTHLPCNTIDIHTTYPIIHTLWLLCLTTLTMIGYWQGLDVLRMKKPYSEFQQNTFSQQNAQNTPSIAKYHSNFFITHSPPTHLTNTPKHISKYLIIHLPISTSNTTFVHLV